MRFIDRILLCWPLAIALHAADPVAPPPSSPTPATAETIAAAMIRTRATDLAPAQPVQSRNLALLAESLENGRISLAQALQVLQIAEALRPAVSAPLRAQPTAAGTVAAEQVTSILDGKPPAPAARAVPAATAGQPQPRSYDTPAVLPSAPRPVANPATAPAALSPAVAATAVAAVPPATAVVSATQIPLTTSVLAVEKNTDDQKPALVMIDAGTKSGVSEGERFAIRRQGKTIVLAQVSQVKETMAICVLIPKSWVDEKEQIKEGDEAVSVP